MLAAAENGERPDPRSLRFVQHGIVRRLLRSGEEETFALIRVTSSIMETKPPVPRAILVGNDDRIIGSTECFAAFDAEFNCEKVLALTQRTTIYSAIKAERDSLPMCIDAVFTWLAKEKERFCQLMADEINALDLKVRQKFPEPIFEAYKGLSDAADRNSQKQPYWDFDWSTGEKRRVVPENKPE
jgi:hypothetical protein